MRQHSILQSCVFFSLLQLQEGQKGSIANYSKGHQSFEEEIRNKKDNWTWYEIIAGTNKINLNWLEISEVQTYGEDYEYQGLNRIKLWEEMSLSPQNLKRTTKSNTKRKALPTFWKYSSVLVHKPR